MIAAGLPLGAVLWRTQNRRRTGSAFARTRLRFISAEPGIPETSAPSLQTVIPANAGIQRLQAFSHERHWIPAFAGMTSKRAEARYLKQQHDFA
jgi:hypothetical protein